MVLRPSDSTEAADSIAERRWVAARYRAGTVICRLRVSARPAYTPPSIGSTSLCVTSPPRRVET